MNTTQYFNIVAVLNEHIHLLLNGFVFQGYHAIASGLKYPLGLSIVIYIVLLGYSITQGWVECSINQFVKSAIKIGIIYTFAMNWSFFSEYMVGLIQNGADELGGFIFHSHSGSVNDGLQTILSQYVQVGEDLIKQAGWMNLDPLFEALVIWFSGIAFTLVALFFLNVSYIMLAILLTAAPLFISFYLFSPTQRFFDRWLGYLCGYGLQIFLISIALGFVLNLIHWIMVGFSQNTVMMIKMLTFVPVLIVTLFGICLIWKVARLALEIGLAMSTGSVSGAVNQRSFHKSSFLKPLSTIARN